MIGRNHRPSTPALLLVLAFAIQTGCAGGGLTPSGRVVSQAEPQTVWPVQLVGDTIRGDVVSTDTAQADNSYLVTLRRTGTGDSLIASTFGRQGDGFTLSGVLPGGYDLLARSIGYRSRLVVVEVSTASAPPLLIQLTPHGMPLEVICAGSCPPPIPRAAIRGQVRCSEQALSVPPGVRVDARAKLGSLEWEANLDPDGRFLLTRLRLERWHVVVRDREGDLISKVVTLKSVRDTATVNFVLRCR